MIYSKGMRNGFPWHIAPRELWDGVTKFDDGYGGAYPPNPAGEPNPSRLNTKFVPVAGDYTFFPIGFTPSEYILLEKRIRKMKAIGTVSIAGRTLDAVEEPFDVQYGSSVAAIPIDGEAGLAGAGRELRAGVEFDQGEPLTVTWTRGEGMPVLTEQLYNPVYDDGAPGIDSYLYKARMEIRLALSSTIEAAGKLWPALGPYYGAFNLLVTQGLVLFNDYTTEGVRIGDFFWAGSQDLWVIPPTSGWPVSTGTLTILGQEIKTVNDADGRMASCDLAITPAEFWAYSGRYNTATGAWNG